MEIRILSSYFCVNLFLLVTAALICRAQDINAPPNPLTLEWAIDNPRLVTREMLKDPKNAQVLAELKERALKTHQSDSVLPLLKLGDPDVMQDSVFLYQKRDLRYHTDEAFENANNPNIISLIGENLNKQESVSNYTLHGDILLNPISVQTSWIIKKIILSCPDFSTEMHNWAKALPDGDDALRQVMRVWWNRNKTLLEAKQYGQVKPPKEIPAASSPK